MPSAPQLEAGAAAALVVAGGDDDGAGAVAEEHGGAAVAVVGEARQRLGAAHQHDTRAAALDQRGRLVQGVEEAGAGGVEVAGGGVARADAQAPHRGRGPGVTRSGVIVETMTWSTSAASRPASASAATHASAARAASGSPGSR